MTHFGTVCPAGSHLILGYELLGRGHRKQVMFTGKPVLAGSN